MGLIALLPLNLGVFNPFKEALKDFDFNDVAYVSALNKDKDTTLDNRIVIVNIGHLDRMGIAHLLEMVNAGKPKVIGVVFMFN